MDLISNFSLDPSTDSSRNFNAEFEKNQLVWTNSCYEEGQYFLDKSDEIKQVERYISYLMGAQWPKNRPAYKAAPVDNRLWKIMTNLVSFLTDVKPTWDVTTGNKNYNKTCTILNDLTSAWWLAEDVDLSLAQIIVYAAITTGYGRLGWNDDLCGGLGDQELRPVGPSDLMPIRPLGPNIQDCQAVVYRCVKPLSWFRTKYGAAGYRVKPDPSYSVGQRPLMRPAWVNQSIWTVMSPGMRKIIGTTAETSASVYPAAEYREYWAKDAAINESGRDLYMGTPGTNWQYTVPPGKPLYPRGRLMITGGSDVLLHDGPNPFWHGRFPFEKLCLNTVPWQWHGPSEFRVQLPLQDVVNQIMAGVLDMTKKCVNPVLLSPENAFSAAVRQSLEPGMPGAKLFFSQNASTPPQYQNPPQLPGYVLDMMQWAMREMDDHSGILDLQSISRMGQIPAADTLEQLKEGQQSVIRLKGRYIEVFLRNIGTMAVSNFMQFYTQGRRMRKLGLDGLTFQDFDFDPGNMIPNGADPREFAQNFFFNIKPGSLLNTAHMQRAMVLMQLRARGDCDLKTLLDALDLGQQKDQIIANLKQEGADIFLQMVKSKMGGKGGGTVPTDQILNAIQGSQGGGAQPAA